MFAMEVIKRIEKLTTLTWCDVLFVLPIFTFTGPDCFLIILPHSFYESKIKCYPLAVNISYKSSNLMEVLKKWNQSYQTLFIVFIL